MFGVRNNNDELKKYKEYVSIRLGKVMPVLQKVAMGDFSQKIEIPEEEEFIEIFVALNLMIDDLKELTTGLKAKIEKRTKYLQNKVEDLDKTREAILNVAEDAELEKQRAAEEKDKINAILHSIGDGVFVVDRNLMITMYNQVAADISGFSIEEAVGKKYDQVLRFIFEADEKTTDRFIKETFTTGEIQEMANHTVLIRKDGSKVPVADSAAPIKDKNGQVVECVVVFRDVTREQEIDRMKTEFVSIASHELRTPLTAIDGLVSMMLNGEYGEVSKNLIQPLEDVGTSSERLIHLVNDLLNLSRIQAGRLQYTLSEFSIVDSITKVVSLMQPLSKQKGLQLTATKLEPCTVQGDSDKAEQVLNNLIGNSLKFTDKGSITVSTKVIQDSVQVAVTDTGIGIAKENQSRLFGQFQQLHSDLGRPTGTGLGLHISREIVRKMGGDLWIEKSEIGIGSTFIFSIPKAKSQLATKVNEEIDKEAKENFDQKSDKMK